MSDPIIEAAVRALNENAPVFMPMEALVEIASTVVTTVTPLILERAAQVADEHFSPDDIECFAEKIATAIRALRKQP